VKNLSPPVIARFVVVAAVIVARVPVRSVMRPFVALRTDVKKFVVVAAVVVERVAVRPKKLEFTVVESA